MQDLSETRNVTELTVKVGELFSDLPLPYKFYAFHPDVLLVMGGQKAATDVSFVGNTYDPLEFEQFSRAFSNFGIKMTELEITVLKDGTPLRLGLMYDPNLLKEQTSQSKYAPPYDGKMPLREYMSGAESTGYDINGVMGKIYSFPESAIGDYVSRKVGKKSGTQQTFHLGETYWCFEPVQQDVINREAVKGKLFDRLEKSQDFLRLVNDPDHEKSNEEWRSRLPQQLRPKAS